MLYACERYVQCLSNSAAAPTRTLLHSECMCTCHTCCATGMVWAGVAAVSKAPSDNKACLFKCLAAVIGVMKDALREVSLGLLMEPHEPPPQVTAVQHGTPWHSMPLLFTATTTCLGSSCCPHLADTEV